MTPLSLNLFNWFRTPSHIELAQKTIKAARRMALEHSETGEYHQSMGKFYADQANRLQAYVNEHARLNPISGLEVTELPSEHPLTLTASPAPKPAKRSARLAAVDGKPTNES